MSTSELLRFQCPCGKRLKAPLAASGKRVRCPACQAIVAVPAATPPRADDEDWLSQLAHGEEVAQERATTRRAAQGGTPDEPLGLAPEEPPARMQRAVAASDLGPPRRCRACDQEYPAAAKICVNCGLDLKTGRPVQMVDDSALDRTYEVVEAVITPLSWLLRSGIWPVASEAFGTRKPWVVRGVVVLTTLVSIWFFWAGLIEPTPGAWALMHWSGDPQTQPLLAAELSAETGWSIAEANRATTFRPIQWLTNTLLHGGLMHLVGNMVFLVVLGSPVNAGIGNLLTLMAYVVLALGSSIIEQIAVRNDDWHASLGASGAVMGLAGMYLVLYPVAKVHMVFWWRIFLDPNLKMFAIRGFWLVGAYIALDIVMTVIGAEDGVAHWAHLGGFFVGAALALLLLACRLVHTHGADILTVTLGHRAFALIGRPTAPRVKLP